MKKKLIIGVGAIVALFLAYYFFQEDTSDQFNEVFTEVKMGNFQIDVTTTGELEARNSTKILGPNGIRRAGIWQVKIEHIIEEGKVVEKGDYIAQLDKSELMDRVSKSGNDYQQSLSEYIQTKMDTALELRKARDELINQGFDVEEKEIAVEQSQFEPQAVQRQNEINLEKAKRKLQQSRENYQLQSQKAIAQMQQAAAKMMDDKQDVNFFEALLSEFRIMAPESGMVIYQRDWRGQKLGVGASISSWDMTVATLPDLTQMVSKTYVNEIDIRTVKAGQEVMIGLDAFPDKKLTGKVMEVANIGEQKPNTDSKVFQVLIEVNEADTTLRPAMTTSNTIISEVVSEVLFVPLEAVHSQGDSLSYVIVKEGISFKKQEVELGKSNANEIVINRGLAEGNELYLSIPEGAGKKDVVMLDKEEDNNLTINQ